MQLQSTMMKHVCEYSRDQPAKKIHFINITAKYVQCNNKLKGSFW